MLRLAALAEQSPDFIGISNPGAHGTYLNPAGRAMAGIGATADITNYALIDFFAPDSRAYVHNVVLPALAGPEAKWEGELRMRHLVSGMVFPVFYKGVPRA